MNIIITTQIKNIKRNMKHVNLINYSLFLILLCLCEVFCVSFFNGLCYAEIVIEINFRY